MHGCLLNCVIVFVTPWTVALQAPLSNQKVIVLISFTLLLNFSGLGNVGVICIFSRNIS